MDTLFELLSKINVLSETFKEALRKELIPISLPKNHILLEAPKIAQHLYFIKNGFAMSYNFHEGRRVVENFWQSNEVITSTNSFIEQIPSKEFVQLMENSDLLCISYAGAQRILQEFPEAQNTYHILLNRHYENCRKRIQEMQRLSAPERFTKLLTTYRHVEQIIPQDAISSYLGITPQSLSRIKRNERRL